MRRRYTWALALVAALVLSMAGAQSTSAASGHTVTVKVTTGGGHGIPDVELVLSQDVDPHYAGSENTDASGVATFTDVPDGSFALTGTVHVGSSHSIDQTIAVSGADVSTTIKIAGTVALFGTVTDEQSGAPIADADVALTAWGEGEAEYGEASTGPDGTYATFVGVGEYRVTYSASGYWQKVPGKVTATAGKDVTLNVALAKPSGVSGRVTFAGRPIASHLVHVANEAIYTSVETTANGTFMSPVPAGSYTVSISRHSDDPFLTTFFGGTVREPDAKSIKTTNGKPAGGVNISAKADATIKGVVKDSKGKPMKGASVYASNLNRAGKGHTTTNAEGAYVLHGLATGKVKVTADHSDGAVATTTVSAIQGKTRTAKTLVPHYLGTATITGTIAVKNGRVRMVDMTLTNSKNVEVGYGLVTKSGKVTFAHVPAGTYTVAIGGANTATKVTVKSGKTASFGKLVRGKQSTVKGYVRTPSGKAAKNVRVTLVDSYGTEADTTSTDDTGAYSIKGLVKGKYTLQAEPIVAGTDAIGTTSFTVKAGNGATKTIKLTAGATLKGFVRNSKGEPVAGIRVSISENGRYVETNAEGAYVVTGAAAGTVQVSFHDPYTGGYRDATKSIKVKAGKMVKLPTVRVR